MTTNPPNMNDDLWEERRRTAKDDNPIEQQLRKELELILQRFQMRLMGGDYQLNPLFAKDNAKNELADLFDTYAARRAGLGASEKPQPQEEVGGKQVDTLSPEKEN